METTPTPPLTVAVTRAITQEAYAFDYPLAYDLTAVGSQTTAPQAPFVGPVNLFEYATALSGPSDHFVNLNNNTLLVENPIDRYSIGDRTPGVRYNDDVSLDLSFQHAMPGADHEANWLPRPVRSFRHLMRMYQPQAAMLDGGYELAPIIRPSRPLAASLRCCRGEGAAEVGGSWAVQAHQEVPAIADAAAVGNVATARRRAEMSGNVPVRVQHTVLPVEDAVLAIHGAVAAPDAEMRGR